MTPDMLLKHFDRIAEGPDAIPRLRRFILDLAVRGKLVEQDPDDEPAAKLLTRIKKEKVKLVAEGTIKRQESLTLPDKGKIQFELPPNWEITTLQSVCISIADGDHLPPPKTDQGVPFLVIGNVRWNSIDFSGCRFVSDKYFNALDPVRRPTKGDILYTLVGSFGIPVPVVDDRPFCIQRHIGVLRPSREIDRDFLLRTLESGFIYEQASLCATGIAQKTVPLAGLRRISVPLPPLAEERRIVEKVDELMTLCDALEAAQQKRESRRDRLVAASLHALGNGDNAEADERPSFADSTRFYLNHLPRLTTRPEHIKQLRQTILSLAVRGKLVPQDTKDGTGDTSFPKLASAAIQPEDARFPSQWLRVPLGKTGEWRGGGTPSKSRPDYWTGDIPWVSPKDMKVLFVADAQDHISKAAVEDSSVRLIPPGSLLMVVRGMILARAFPVALTTREVTINQDMKALLPHEAKTKDYLLLALRAFEPDVLSAIEHSTHGTCRLETDFLQDFMIPLPPLAEQHRIVAKVDELMALCDALETDILSAADTRSRFLEATLRDALSKPTLENCHETS